MTKKVKLAIFDRDLKAREFGSYPVSKDGSKIQVRRGGKRNFNPIFDNDSYIEFPYRRLSSPWKVSWDRIYFAPNGAKHCVNFRTGEVFGPDPNLVMEAAENTILQNMGTEKTETPLLMYVILAVVVIMALKVFGVLV
jgi:hypothetical protein